MTEKQITEAHLNDLVEKIKTRTRYNKFDEVAGDIVPKPTRDEIIAAIFDGLGELNSFEPATTYTIDDIMGNVDVRWQKLLILAASKNFIMTLVFEWTANGLTAQIEDLQLENKLPDYKDLLSTLDEQFKDLAERLKKSALRFIRTSSFATTSTSKVSGYSSYSSTMCSRTQRSLNVGRFK